MSNMPPQFEVQKLPDGMAQVNFYFDAVQLAATEDDVQRWTAKTCGITTRWSESLEGKIEDKYQEWVVEAEIACVSEIEEEVKKERNRLLVESDYTMTADYPCTDSERNAWLTYRQVLRDLPDQQGYPLNVVWPDAPAREKSSDSVIGVLDELLLTISEKRNW